MSLILEWIAEQVKEHTLNVIVTMTENSILLLYYLNTINLYLVCSLTDRTWDILCHTQFICQWDFFLKLKGTG